MPAQNEIYAAFYSFNLYISFFVSFSSKKKNLIIFDSWIRVNIESGWFNDERCHRHR